MRGGKKHPAGGKVPGWALRGLGPSSRPRKPKPVRGQMDIYDALWSDARLRPDGQLEGQTDIYDVLDDEDDAS
jgi:hypothetical protein